MLGSRGWTELQTDWEGGDLKTGGSVLGYVSVQTAKRK